MSTTSSASPGVETSRAKHFSLDTLRGIALLGILFISIREFGGITFNDQLLYINHQQGGNYRLFSIISLLFEGKMIALLAMVFGAGMVLFLHKKERPVAIDNADAFIRQQVGLIILGLILAFIVLWPNELLYPFGIAAIMLFAFWKLPSKSLFILALFCTLVYCGKNFWNYNDDKTTYAKYVAVTDVEKKFKQDSTARAKDSIAQTKDTTGLQKKIAKIKLADSLARKKDTLTSKQAEEKSTWEGMLKSMKYDSAKNASQQKTMRAGYSKLWFTQKDKAQSRESNWMYKIGIWDISSMMFLGMALLGIGFFHHKFTTGRYLLTALLLIVAGGALGWLRLCYFDQHVLDYTKYIQTHALPYNFFLPIEQGFLATGYAALAMALLHARVLQWLWIAMAAIGKIALTNYILQVMACAFIFYGYAFGYYKYFEQWELYLIVAEIMLVQAVFSIFWLRYYRTGPVEWLLDCAVYGKWLPFEKQPASTETTTIN